MIMYSYKRIAVTNRRIFFESRPDTCRYGDNDAYVRYLAKLADNVDIIILREKELDAEEYTLLAEKLFDELALLSGENKSGKRALIVLHSYIETAVKINYKRIHLPLDVFQKNLEILNNFELKGVSVHSLEEARFAQEHGADYITASHIFQTECKKDLEPKGLDFLRNICENIKIPVYALGGITKENELDTIMAGALGACRMSDYMKQ